MATATAESPGSDKATLKRLLKSASQEAVNAAIALDAGGAAIILLDKRKNPRALLKQLKDDAPDSRNHRFGTVAVVAEQKLVRFTLDKQAGAMLRKLVVALKGTGYRKIEIGTEGANDFESADSDDDASDEPAPEDPPREDPGPARAIAALTRRLTDLVRKLGSTGTPPPKPAIDLARTIKAALAANDDKTATTQLDALKKLVDAPPTPDTAQGTVKPADPAALGKAKQVWVGTRAKISGDLQNLFGTFRQTFAGQDGGDQIAKEFRSHIDTVLGQLDDELAHALDALAKAPDAERAKAADRTRKLIERYSAHVTNDEVVAALDDNPLVKINLRATIGTALSAIAKQVR